MELFGLVCFYGLTAIDDIRTKKVKVLEIVIFGLAGVLLNFIYKPHSFMSLAGGVMVGALLYVFSVLTKEKIGKGDALIIMVSGLYLGFMNTVILLWLSSLIAAVSGLIVVKRNSSTKDVEIPFVPFLLVGYIGLHVISALGGVTVC